MGEDHYWKLVLFGRPNFSLKYGTEEGGWFTKAVAGSDGVSLWKEINEEASQLKLNSDFVIGDGSKVRFWEDVWCREEPLCVFSHSL